MTNQTLGILKNKVIISALIFVCIHLYAQDKPNEKLISRSIRGDYNYNNLPYGSGKVYKFNQVSPHENNLMLEDLYQAGYDSYINGDHERALTMITEFINTEIYLTGMHANELKLKKHYACEIAARMFIHNKKFKKALKYLELFRYTYPSYSTCGAGAAASVLVYEVLKADCLNNMGKTDEAISLLENYLFFPLGLTDNTEAINKLLGFYIVKYGKDFLKKSLSESKIYFNDKKHLSVYFLDKEFPAGFSDESLLIYCKGYSNGEKLSQTEILDEAFKNHYTYKLIMEN